MSIISHGVQRRERYLPYEFTIWRGGWHRKPSRRRLLGYCTATPFSYSVFAHMFRMAAQDGHRKMTVRVTNPNTGYCDGCLVEVPLLGRDIRDETPLMVLYRLTHDVAFFDLETSNMYTHVWSRQKSGHHPNPLHPPMRWHGWEHQREREQYRNEHPTLASFLDQFREWQDKGWVK